MSAKPVPKGQSSLFSFFKKGPAPIAVDISANAPNISSPVADPVKDSLPVPPPPKKPKRDDIDSIPGPEIIGKRVKMFWPNDDEWYAGTFIGYEASSARHVVAYDDGQREILDLKMERYKLIDGPPAKRKNQSTVLSDSENSGEETTVKRNTKKAKIIDDDDGEWDGDASTSSGSEGSQYSADDKSSDSGAGSFSEEEWASSEDEGKSKAKKSRITKGAKVPQVKPPLSKNNVASNIPPRTPHIASGGEKKTSAPPSTGGTSTASLTPNTPASNSKSSPLPSPANRNWLGLGGTASSASPRAKETSAEDTNPEEPLEMPEGVLGLGSHEHYQWKFFVDIRDKNGIRKGEQGYNPRTWLVPASFLKEQTPAMAQWFEFKCNNFDTVLFFKVGKFYELFHMDADVGFKELDLIYMKGSKGHSGFPEVSYGKYANILVSKGYRVARVEQTETPDMMKERNKNAAKGTASKVVSRELCSVLSMGTRTYCHLDDTAVFTSEESTGISPASLLLCIKESPVTSESNADKNAEDAVVEYGICYVDTIIGIVTLAQFQDDSQRTRLRTMLSTMQPTEVLFETIAQTGSDAFSGASAETVGAVRLAAPKALHEYLRSGDEFPGDSRNTISMLKAGKYFNDVTGAEYSSWPVVLQAVIGGLGDNSSELVALALGGAIWHLRRALIDHEVISLGQFMAYVPQDKSEGLSVSVSGDSSSPMELCDTTGADLHGTESNSTGSNHMVLDAVALANLEILQNNFDKTEKGSLWAFINRCKTSFGRRLLYSWLVKPLYLERDIQFRAAAVEELVSSLHVEAESARKLLKTVPDLERLLSRVHTNGSKTRALNHPDGRACMYEDKIYSTRKINDLIDTLRGFETLLKLETTFNSSVSISSVLLQRVLRPAGTRTTGKFPFTEMKNTLKHFREIFDETQAKRDGTIRPHKGLNADYDVAVNDIKELDRWFQHYLNEQKKETGISDICYWGTGKDRYQIEVPMAFASKVPNKWSTKSQKKTHRRYWTAKIEEKLAELVEAEERMIVAEKDTMRSVFERFDKERGIWAAAVSCTAAVDALLSLAIISSNPAYVWPRFESGAEKGPFLKIRNGRHPMLEQSLIERGLGDYIPNDLTLGGHWEEESAASQSTNLDGAACELPRILLLSGPNMGGKSTLLRQTCLICILAQLGCRVPADECIMTPVDRIFTRVGASDRILAGQSTFFVELAETALILKSATKNSLCILDELGRGTSTFDGTAIAHSVVEYLSCKIRCRTMFATHYHTLVDDWSMDPRVKLGHMDCIVQSDTSLSTDKDTAERVTFLYQLCDGRSSKSYGVNVARLAGLPNEVLALAVKKSAAFIDSSSGKKANIAGDINIGHNYSSTENNSLNLIYRRYFERLTSLLAAEMTNEELYITAVELWKRFKNDVSLA